MKHIVDVSITAPDADWLTDHLERLVADRLAASGNVFPAIRSVYRWQGAVKRGSEAYLVLHTQPRHVATIIERTNAEHPYDTVHILATEIVDADPRYQQWVIDATTS